jgi:hypothetical protein
VRRRGSATEMAQGRRLREGAHSTYHMTCRMIELSRKETDDPCRTEKKFYATDLYSVDVVSSHT